MKFHRSLLLASILALFAATPVAAQPSTTAVNPQVCSSQEEAANGKLLEKLVGPTPPRAEDLRAMMHPDLITHVPEEAYFLELNHASGKAGMELFSRARSKVGVAAGAPPDLRFKYSVTLVKCDLIMVVTEWPLPDPRNPGKTYTGFSFDLYRIKDGKIYEHWNSGRLADSPPAYSAAPFDQLKPGSGTSPPAPAH